MAQTKNFVHTIMHKYMYSSKFVLFCIYLSVTVTDDLLRA